MKKRQLGKTKLYVTEMGFGGAPIGNLHRALSNDDAYQTIDAAWQGGIRYFDTAPQYGHGLSEHRLGRYSHERPRDQFVLSTKVGKVLTASRNSIKTDEPWFIKPLPNKVHYDYTRAGILRSIEDSLQRLRLGHIDIVHIHDLDRLVLGDDFSRYFKQTMESGVKALEELKKEKIIDAFSLGIKEWQVCAEALKYAEFDCFMLQDNYTLLDQDALDFLDTCHRRKISVLLAGPFSSGILVKGAVAGARYNYVPASDSILKRVQAIETVCQKFDIPLPAAALQFPLRHPAIASVVTGMRTAEQAKKNLAWLSIEIPELFWETLKERKIIPEHAP